MIGEEYDRTRRLDGDERLAMETSSFLQEIYNKKNKKFMKSIESDPIDFPVFIISLCWINASGLYPPLKHP